MMRAVVLPRPLLSRIGKVATDQFEPLESMVLILIESGLQHHLADRTRVTRRRDGGKAPAKTLLRPLKASSKRARVLRWFLHSLDASVAAAMVEFGMTREAIFATWTTLHAVHGVGYSFDAVPDTIMVRLPCGEADLFA